MLRATTYIPPFQGSVVPKSKIDQNDTVKSFSSNPTQLSAHDVTQTHILCEILNELRHQRQAPALDDDVTRSEIVREWQLVAMVLDRLFLVVFVFAFFLTTLLILLGGQN